MFGIFAPSKITKYQIMKILYFTATGNCLYVAKQLGGELLSIPQLMKSGTFSIEDDVVGVISPVYCADMPKMVQRYLGQAKIKAHYVFGICTYGYQAGGAMQHMHQYLTKAAGHAEYVNKLIMVDTALQRFETAKQIANLPKKEVGRHLAEIVADINSRRSFIGKTNFNDRMIDRVYHALGKAEIADDKAKKYIVDENCIGCGTCAKVCPSDNIEIRDKRPVFLNRCEGCFGCLHNCPKVAIHLKDEQSTVRFRNSEVKISEIIAANK